MTTKTVYQYDRAGLYAGETVADESPLEPGVWLIPARCTETAPPATWPETKWPRFNGASWELVVKPRQPAQVDDATDAVTKLQAFLAANPDVVALISNGGGANV